jgi:predicted metal-dependent hydrolase
MKRLLDLARAAGDAALQLTLPLFDPPSAAPPRHPLRLPPGVAPGQPPGSPPRAGRRVARLGEHAVEYELRRSRRRTIGFYVDDTGLRVTAPRWVTLADIDSALADKERWILRKLVEWREHAQRRERLTVRWEDGGTVAFLGRTLTMRLEASPRRVVLEGDTLRVSLPPQADPEQLRAVVQVWLQGQAREVFAQRLPIYSARLGQAPTGWRLSSARTRWGSCAPDGSIRLNWRLVHFPIEIVDYVVAHELAHLREMNHGPRFWATVQALLPEFEAARRMLKDYPDDLTMS